jgi:hypothetical protein
MKLLDEKGRPIPVRVIKAMQAYPDSFDVTDMHLRLMNAYTWYSGPPLPKVLIPNKPVPRLLLGDYFKSLTAGEYKLIVQAKVYRRIRAGSETCERVDFPAVVVPLHIEKER